MLESLDLSKKLSARSFKRILPGLQNRLRHLQYQIREAQIPVILVFEGWDLTGKGGIVRMLAERMDPRGFRSYPIYPPSKHELGYSFLRRFWLRLPERGEFIIFYHSWYGRVLGDRVEKRCSKKEWKSAYKEINEFEQQLTDDGTLILKYWLHFTKKDQKKRLAKYAKDPFEKWQITSEVKKRHKKYEKYLSAIEDMLEQTNSTAAPWILVPGRHFDFAAAKIFRHVIDSLEAILRKKIKEQGSAARIAKLNSQLISDGKMPGILDRVDLNKQLTEKEYEEELNDLQNELRKLQFDVEQSNQSVILVYEGWDAAGKGGNINRLTAKLDPRWFEVHSIAAPTQEERMRHYLWRFWKRIPPAGMICIFDRSWYGRVLVERVENFATPEEWDRAYREIREFERQLTSSGAILLKFWMHISKEEQLRRFHERKKLVYKQHKITDDDWRNRKKWDDYFTAVTQMLEQTNTSYAPWIVVEGNCKWWARIRTLRATVDRIKKYL